MFLFYKGKVTCPRSYRLLGPTARVLVGDHPPPSVGTELVRVLSGRGGRWRRGRPVVCGGRGSTACDRAHAGGRAGAAVLPACFCHGWCQEQISSGGTGPPQAGVPSFPEHRFRPSHGPDDLRPVSSPRGLQCPLLLIKGSPTYLPNEVKGNDGRRGQGSGTGPCTWPEVSLSRPSTSAPGHGGLCRPQRGCFLGT